MLQCFQGKKHQEGAPTTYNFRLIAGDVSFSVRGKAPCALNKGIGNVCVYCACNTFRSLS